MNQVLYPNKFDNVLGELVMERPDDIKLSENLQDLFPEADQVLKDDTIKDEIRNEVLLPNIEKVLQKSNKGNTLLQLESFEGRKNEKFQNKDDDDDDNFPPPPPIMIFTRLYLKEIK